jgi:hypothetical protein
MMKSLSPSWNSCLRYLAILLTSCLCITLLSACSEHTDDILAASPGSSTPQDVVEGFFEDFNQALKEMPESDSVRRRYWADRLAGYFAPNERVDQRDALAMALYTYAMGSQQLAENEKLQFDITFSSLELLQSQADAAQVRLVEGMIRLRIMRVDGESEIPVRIDERPLGETIGKPDGIIPLVRVNGRWFLSEG